MKKIVCLLLAVTILCSCVLCGCSSGYKGTDENVKIMARSDYNDPVKSVKATASEDKYRNYYEIFVNSFCDSNGDEIGDLNGITSKLDYLNDGDPNSGNDLGIDGIWLTPIMPSKSYHKYDVENYYDIDPDFGTLDDFKKLVKECHKRGIKLIIDLVLNHISSQNPLYEQAVDEVSKGKMDGAAEYFEIHNTSYFDADTPVNLLSNGYACEANFSPDMPEWNLNSDKTREEFTKIAKFWLDMGVDGFRLDALRYYNNKDTDGVAFLKWFYKTCQGIKPDVYMVGEDWEGDTNIQEFYESGIDSLFAFKYAQTSGLMTNQILTQNGSVLPTKIMNYDKKMAKSNENAINAMFLSNHDQVRIANTLEPKGLDYEKFAAAVYMLYPGNSYTYYGEEIGSTAPLTTSDSAYRMGMVFDSSKLPDIYVNGQGYVEDAPKYGGVEQQLKDNNSLLNFYRRVITIKNQNPEIARGKITGVEKFDDKQIGAYYVEYKGSKLMIVQNFSADSTKQIEITDKMMKNPEIRADLVASSPIDKDGKFTSTSDENALYLYITLKDGKLTLPAHSVAILKQS